MLLIQEELKPFIDKYGLISPYPDGASSGNGIRYTAEYVVALFQNYKSGEISEEFKRIKSSIEACQKLPGLYNRSPDDTRLEAPDDMVGLGTISNFISADIAKTILQYGRNQPFPYYCYNNQEPGKFRTDAWLGRQQQVICHLQFAAGEKPPLWRKLWWCLAIIISAFSDIKDQDGYVLSWHLVKTAKSKSFLCDLAIKFWSWRQKNRELSIDKVLRDYFGFNHPLTKWLSNDTI